MTPHMAYHIWNLAINMQFKRVSQVSFITSCYNNCFIKTLITVIGHII